ncbi:hypothetical protein BH24DEI2_BH24DEI2_20920 [soil metagenome]
MKVKKISAKKATETAKLVSLLALGLVLGACSAPRPHLSRPYLSVPQDVQVSAQVGQARTGVIEVANPGGSPLAYSVVETADWLEFTGATAGRLEPGGAVSLGFTARCPEVTGTVQTTLSVTSDDPDRTNATTLITLVCADALLPGEEGFVAALGTWNWATNDDGTLGSALLLGFRYRQPTSVAVSIVGPAGWNGDAVRQLVLPGPTGSGNEDVWTYDLLTDATHAAPTGTYRVTATTDRSDTYTVDLALSETPFLQTPKNLAVTPSASGVTVAWTPVAGAKAYYAVVTDPTADVVPQRVAGPAVPGLSVLNAPSYARAFTSSTTLDLAASLVAGRRYQVTVVAFNSDLVFGDSETLTLPVRADTRFDTSSAVSSFRYLP